MTTDTRPLAERVADILATEDCIVTPLLREAMEEIERLTASVLALHAKRNQDVDERNAELTSLRADYEMRGTVMRQMEEYIEGFRRDLEGANVDAERMEALAEYAKHKRTCLKGIGGDPAYLCDCGLEVLLARVSGR